MSPEQIEATMRTLVADCLAVDAQRVRRDSRLTDELRADSLDFIDLLFVIEKEFGIKVRDLLDDHRGDAEKSTLITTSLPYEEWHHISGTRLVEPLLSRLRHRCTTVHIDGPSLRDPKP